MNRSLEPLYLKHVNDINLGAAVNLAKKKKMFALKKRKKSGHLYDMLLDF